MPEGDSVTLNAKKGGKTGRTSRGNQSNNDVNVMDEIEKFKILVEPFSMLQSVIQSHTNDILYLDNLISIQAKKNLENEEKIKKLEAKVQELSAELERKRSQ